MIWRDETVAKSLTLFSILKLRCRRCLEWNGFQPVSRRARLVKPTAPITAAPLLMLTGPVAFDRPQPHPWPSPSGAERKPRRPRVESTARTNRMALPPSPVTHKQVCYLIEILLFSFIHGQNTETTIRLLGCRRCQLITLSRVGSIFFIYLIQQSTLQ